MSTTTNPNTVALDYLIHLEIRGRNMSGSEFYQSVLKAIGEAGGIKAVEHLASIDLSDHPLNSLTMRVLISAIGRAGRIS